ncbi:hypothetical protein [Streptomyces sp. NBC_01207]|uniref:hypothetical protein n=1 Tax=Streptomyces sp. NBC_01207 TaxID=2903772 RepID=UPI002E163C73|nr:hypothetical protein OG457_38175 [Streptomyces sp. NBC_01207]
MVATGSAVTTVSNSLVRLVGGGVASALASAILSSDTSTGAEVPTVHAYPVSFTGAAVSVGLAALCAGCFGWMNKRTAAPAGKE